MNLKDNIIEYGINAGIVFGGFYLIYGKKQNYLNFVSIVSILAVRYMGKKLNVWLQKDNAGGTTPYNPLKIPAKKTTPAHII